ncbi:MAG: ribosome silencing factor [Anaerolineae bacterium]
MDTAAEKKAANILMLDVKELTTLTDYFVICEGASVRQMNAINDAILEELKGHQVKVYHKEGTPESGWILLDYGHVLAHIFSPERRAYYRLEELWQEAPTVMKML